MKHTNGATQQSHRRIAFTLAEVLITLGVIGIVAAMTIPNLVQSYKKKVVETKLVKFYSTISNAIKLSEVDNGQIDTWEQPYDSIDVEDYYNEYFDKYIKILRKDTYNSADNNKYLVLYFSDGSLADVRSDVGGLTCLFYPNAKDFDISQGIDSSRYGISSFAFTFNPHVGSEVHTTGRYGFEPYMYLSWYNLNNGNQLSHEKLINDKAYGCSKTAEVGGVYCTALIYQNNWKIPEDYPFKF